MPRSLIDAERSSSSESLKSLRGLRGFGRRNSIGTRRWPRARSVAAASEPGIADESGQAAAETRSDFLCHIALAISPHAARNCSFAPDHLGGEADVGLAAGTTDVVEQNRLSMRRRLGHPDVPWNDRVVNLVAHEAAHIRDDLGGKVVARIEHRQHHAVDG